MASLATQRFITRKLLSLPDPVLRWMAGGGEVRQGGRTLDAHFQLLAASARKRPPIWNHPAAEVRALNAAAAPLVGGEAEPGVRFEPLTAQGPRGPIPLRLYRPAAQDAEAPLMVFAHMGGGVIGDLDTCHAFCSILASIGRYPVLSVDYRLAPEHPFPAGLEDVLAAYRFGRDQAQAFGAPAGQAAIGGDSMGGNFAAALCQQLKRAGEPQPTLQLLVFPCVDVACQSGSMTTYADAFPLTRPFMDWMIAHYLRPDDDPADPRLSPLNEPDLTGLAPAIIVTAGFDPLLDQGEAYARRLRAAGVPVTYRCYDSLAHGFTAFTGAVPAADVACREIAGMVREGVEGRVC